MTYATRRSALKTLAIGAAAAPLSLMPFDRGKAIAQTTTANEQAPGFYRFRVGDLVVTTLFDGELRRPMVESYVTNAPLEAVQEAMRRARLPIDHFFNPYVFTAVRSDQGIVLIDTGTGDLFDASIDQGDRSLTAAGIAKEDVALIVITHFHPDHVGGLTTPGGEPAFPNARLLFPEPEHVFLNNSAAHAGMPDMVRGFVPAALDKIAPYAGRMDLYAGGDALSENLTAMATPGHTPGHMAVRITSGGESVIVVGDAITYAPIFAANPGWHILFDMDGPAAEASRGPLIEESVTGGTRLIGTHFPFPGLGSVVREGGSLRYVQDWWAGTLR
ncbi:MAG: MBL fold metallo-hydrolase [Devosia sp.]